MGEREGKEGKLMEGDTKITTALQIDPLSPTAAPDLPDAAAATARKERERESERERKREEERERERGREKRRERERIRKSSSSSSLRPKAAPEEIKCGNIGRTKRGIEETNYQSQNG
jgi:hypothetical protein